MTYSARITISGVNLVVLDGDGPLPKTCVAVDVLAPKKACGGHGGGPAPEHVSRLSFPAAAPTGFKNMLTDAPLVMAPDGGKYTVIPLEHDKFGWQIRFEFRNEDALQLTRTTEFACKTAALGAGSARALPGRNVGDDVLNWIPNVANLSGDADIENPSNDWALPAGVKSRVHIQGGGVVGSARVLLDDFGMPIAWDYGLNDSLLAVADQTVIDVPGALHAYIDRKIDDDTVESLELEVTPDVPLEIGISHDLQSVPEKQYGQQITTDSVFSHTAALQSLVSGSAFRFPTPRTGTRTAIPACSHLVFAKKGYSGGSE